MRHPRFSTAGTWDEVLTAVQAAADARGEVDWRLGGGAITGAISAALRACL
jgi:hypothetical protein